MTETYLTEKQLKKRHFFLKLKIYGVVVAFFFILIGGAYAVFQSPLLNIKKINISFRNEESSLLGEFTNEVSNLKKEEELKSNLLANLQSFLVHKSQINFLLGPRNILAWNPDVLSESKILSREFPELTGFNFEKSYLRKEVNFEFIKRNKLGVWCEEAESTSSVFIGSGSADSPTCFWFDKNGVLFASAPAIEGNLIYRVADASNRSLNLGDKILGDNFLANFFKIIEVLKKSDFQIRSFRIENIDLAEIIANPDAPSSPKIYFSLKDDPIWAENLLKSINKLDLQKASYIDLRVPNRVYYK